MKTKISKMQFTNRRFYKVDGVRVQFNAAHLTTESIEFAAMTVQFGAPVVVFNENLVRVTLVAARCIVAHEIGRMFMNNSTDFPTESDRRAAADLFVIQSFGHEALQHMFAEMLRACPNTKDHVRSRQLGLQRVTRRLEEDGLEFTMDDYSELIKEYHLNLELAGL